MADLKISQLTAITTLTPATDVLPVVDSGGVTKKITTNQILGAGGTATLASATITGALTVDTTTLVVNPAGYADRVGIGTASPATILDIQSAGSVFARIQNTASSADAYLLVKNTVGEGFFGINATGPYIYTAGSLPITFTTATSERYRIASDGVATWSNVGGVAGTAMTLNATGLGVGVASPSNRLEAQEAGTGSGIGGIIASTATAGGNAGYVFRTGGTNRWSLSITGSAGAESIRFYDVNNSATRLLIDSSGNVGIGVAPITSHILSCSGPVGITGTLAGSRTSYITNASAASIYYTDGGGSGYFTDFGNLIIQPRTSAARSVVIATGSTTPVERAVVKSTGQVRFVPLAADPAGAEAGDVYYNSTSNKLKCYNGTTWNDLF